MWIGPNFCPNFRSRLMLLILFKPVSSRTQGVTWPIACAGSHWKASRSGTVHLAKAHLAKKCEIFETSKKILPPPPPVHEHGTRLRGSGRRSSFVRSLQVGSMLFILICFRLTSLDGPPRAPWRSMTQPTGITMLSPQTRC